MKQIGINRIVSLENLKKFIIFNYFPFKKDEIEKLLLENKDLFLMKAPRVVVRGDKVIPYKNFGKSTIVKVDNLKEIVITSKRERTKLFFMKINENEGRLLGLVSPQTLLTFYFSKAFSLEEIGEILRKNNFEKFQFKEEKILEWLEKIKLISEEEEIKKRARSKFEIKTLKIAIIEELKEKRKVELAPPEEHYDIVSYGNNQEDVRYIEVKGCKRLKNTNLIGLSKFQYDFGKEKKDKYWIYLININGTSRIVKIQNPIENLKWIILPNKYFSFILLNEGNEK